MKINVFGLGYVGCVSATCLANAGHDVTGVDVDPRKVETINSGLSPIVEPGLGEAIQKAVGSGSLRATSNGAEPAADISIICVGTPSRENGSLQLKYIKRVCEQIAQNLSQSSGYHVVNIRSTVLPGTIDSVLIPILEKGSGKKAGIDFGVCMNPEFMREGTSIKDFYEPPFTVIGELDSRSGERVARLYQGIEAPLIRTTVRVAEMLKYSCNVFHALKVSFANEIGNICKKLDIDSHELMEIFCQDEKLNLSPYYLKPGFAFGGSCLPKDLRALLHRVKELDLEAPVLNSILPSNRRQIQVAYKLIERTGKRRVGFLGLSFKPGSDDLRESPTIELVEKLIGKGYDVSVYDREVSLARIYGSNKAYIETAIPHISSLMKETVDEVMDTSDVILVAKRSEEFRQPLMGLNGDRVVVDLVRILETEEQRAGYDGICW